MPNEDEILLLRDICQKLDSLIILSKIANRKQLDEYSRQIRRDKVSQKILQLADGTLPSSELVKAAATQLSMAEITIKKRISELAEKGILVKKKEGRIVYYEDSSLFW